ncbi:DNA-binding response regulator, OmpR family, contains REC and winged-helix (wHTH) domain [Roseateles sp. YR242]|uniref:response regulator n=1 Tax=Roseateles sp. YR242 TaxID=1855305 RepID=UPI0008C73E10|nr:response regulator transcription factor [Roseateles sp. YR242]SEL06317.1 DNA-binding response regulator, OmpR family, contains REC and winged-helix (wHTH) domain [Roseateles sp. YR242]
MSLTGSLHVAPPNGVPTPTHIAILDDEPDITLLLSSYLSTHGFRTTQLHSGRALMELMASDPPQLVLLDLGLPGEDGFAIARQLREHWRCGLVIVTGRGDAVDKVVGLEIGADDYVTKPFDLRELVARVKAVLRRLQAEPAPAPPPGTGPLQAPAQPEEGGDRELLHFEGWSLNVAARRLNSPDGEEVVLTTGEFDLLLTFAQHAGRVLSRDFLLEHTRGRESSPFDRTIDVQVGRLRRKLGTDANDGKWIKSIRGAGYLFVPRVSLIRPTA